jgi:hypothetical protein
VGNRHLVSSVAAHQFRGRIYLHAIGGAPIILNLKRKLRMDGLYQPDLSENIDSPFVRDGNNKLVRRSYWLDMNDRTLVMVMTNGIGAHLTNEEKRAHLTDLRREHLIDQVCVQEILPPQK